MKLSCSINSKEGKMRTWKFFAIVMAIVLGCSGCHSSQSFENTIPMIVEFYDEPEEPEEFLDFNPEILGKVDSETEKVLKACQLQVLKYFKDKDIDVLDKLSKLENTYIYCAPDSGIAGFYKPGTCDVYLEADTLLDIDYLKFVYIHELMHYLGFSDDETTMMQEGMADAIAEDILGYSYEYSYDMPRWLCHQLITADPELLSYIICGGDIDDRIDERLEDVPREWYVPEHDMSMSDVLDILLYNIEYDYELDIDTIICYVDQCQSIVVAYCNTFDLTDEQKKELSQFIIEIE